MEGKSDVVKMLIRGVFVGATVGLIVKFVTDRENIKYAAVGATVGALVYVGIWAAKKK